MPPGFNPCPLGCKNSKSRWVLESEDVEVVKLNLQLTKLGMCQVCLSISIKFSITYLIALNFYYSGQIREAQLDIALTPHNPNFAKHRGMQIL